MQRLTMRILLVIAVLLLFGLPTAHAQPCGDTVTVTLGDTLSEIADRCGTTVAALQQANPGITDSTINVGQELNIPNAGRDTSSATPLVALAPLSGAPGEPVEVIANGFPANTNVVIGVGVQGSEYQVVSRVQTTANGAVQAQITIPQSAEGGEQYVVVIENNTLGIRATSLPFAVTSGVGQPTASPTISISPRSGPPGTQVQISASGFPANTDLLIGVGRRLSDFSFSLREQTAGDGTLTTTFNIPEDATPGNTWQVLAEMQSNRDVEAISNLFTVAQPPQPQPQPPEGALFESTDVFLVALNDGANADQSIGCNDSLVPVEVTFEPTIAPLTASLEQLFAIEERFYGRSGLYNALYASELRIDGIDIDNGIATINLSGDLQLSGACDNARALAQIERTATQFDTVDEADVFLDGQPLEQVISTLN